MGKITLTCGHQINSLKDSFNVILPSKMSDFDKDCLVNSIVFVSICKNCFNKYKKLGIILTEEMANKYLKEEIKFKYIW